MTSTERSNDADELNEAWNSITNYLTPKPSSSNQTDSVRLYVSNAEFEAAIDVLHRHNLVRLVDEWFVYTAKTDLRRNLSPRFWAKFDNPDTAQDPQRFSDAIDELYADLHPYFTCAEKIDNFALSCPTFAAARGSRNLSLPQTVTSLFKAVLFHVVPESIQMTVNGFYVEAFHVFQHSTRDSPSDVDCTVCMRSTCTCQHILARFTRVNAQLSGLGLLEKLSGSAITHVVHKVIADYIRDTCRANFESSYLDHLEQWLDEKILCWLVTIYPRTDDITRDTTSTTNVDAFRSRLLHMVYKTYAKNRVGQLFNIIIEFPDSEPALIDLRDCLKKTDLRSKVTESLRTALETRLLHPGVNTSDILTAYIAAIRALRVLDPSGVILDNVCEPVRKYLRSREDTVRRIVSSLTDDGSNELADELVKGEPLVVEGDSDSDEDTTDWENWTPDPVDAHTASKSRRVSDIISMLVNIYGSKELFVNEYQTLLADRILSQFSYDVQREIRYLELLKLRFGESPLHSCEVMLKDVADSRRINAGVREKRHRSGEEDPEDFELQAMILSAQFWPAFREESVTLPSYMNAALQRYTKRYETLKGNRTLVWKNHLGLVTIDIELRDQTLTFTCSPVHTAIIHQFQQQPKWTVDELSSALQMTSSILRRKISWWQTQGLLREESTDTFTLVEDPRVLPRQLVMMEEEEVESATSSAQSQREQELQVFWTYIVGMLTNLESLPLDRIHKLLSMFNMQGACSVHELRAFLETKVKSKKLMYSGGVYRLAN